MHNVVATGDRLEIDAPRNNCPLNETAPHTLLFAGGNGITSIITMVGRFQKLGQSFQLHYFSRSAGHTAFRERLALGAYADNVFFYKGYDIVQTQNALHDALDHSTNGEHFYVCGPSPLWTAPKSARARTRSP